MSILFYSLFVFTFITVANCIANPHSAQIKAELDARKREWSYFAIYTTRSLPYLTLYAQILTLFALFWSTPSTIHFGHSLSSVVFIAYHGINSINPSHLSYHPLEITRIVTAWKPPCSMLVVPWIGLHLQHSVFPFYLHWIQERVTLLDLACAHVLLLIYIFWHLFCWHVQGIPAYPFLAHLRTTGWETVFYATGFVILACLQYLLVNDVT
jgi:hypothetical protein